MTSKLSGLFAFYSSTIQNIKSKEHWFAAVTEANISTVFNDVKFASSKLYDQALDATYNKTHIGGGNHRLFDGSHSITDAWDKAAAASADDTFAQEVLGYMKAMWNDVSTVKGLPFQSLDQASYTEWADTLSKAIPGISKDWLYDLLSFDGAELAGASAGLVAAVFQLRGGDKVKFDQLLGSMSISAVMGANPIMGIITIALAGYAYRHKKNEFDRKSFGKSAAATAFSSMLFLMLGLPFLVELIIVIIAGAYFKNKIINNDDLLALIRSHLTIRFSASKKMVDAVLNNLAEKLKKSSAA